MNSKREKKTNKPKNQQQQKKTPGSIFGWITTASSKKRKVKPVPAGKTQSKCVASQPGAPPQKVSPRCSLSRVEYRLIHTHPPTPTPAKVLIHSTGNRETSTTRPLLSRGWQSGEVNRKQTDKTTQQYSVLSGIWPGKPGAGKMCSSSEHGNWSFLLHGIRQPGNLTALVVIYSFLWEILHMA